MQRREIYSTIIPTEMVDDIMKENPGMTGDQAYLEASYQIEEDRSLLKDEFDDIRGHFVIYGSAGLWDCRHGGFTPLFDSTLGEALFKLSEYLGNCDSEVTVYIDENGDVCARKAHHDGVNLYTLRKLDREYDEDELEEIAATEGGSTRWFEKNAEPCGHHIAERFGWEE